MYEMLCVYIHTSIYLTDNQELQCHSKQRRNTKHILFAFNPMLAQSLNPKVGQSLGKDR